MCTFHQLFLLGYSALRSLNITSFYLFMRCRSEDSDSDDEGSESEVSQKKFESKTYQLTYSDYLAAILDPDMLCGKMNLELLFHTLNPSHLSDSVLKKEMKTALFFGTEEPEVEKEFDRIVGKRSSDDKTLISRDWITDYFRQIKKVLKGKSK